MDNIPNQPATPVVRASRSPIDRQPVITSPSHPNKVGRATDSCFSLVVAQQCGDGQLG